MANVYNIYLDQGVDYSIVVNIFDNNDTPLQTTENSFFSSARKVYSSKKAFDLDVYSHVDGAMTISVPSSVSKDVVPGKYSYDILMIDPSNNTTKILEGLVHVLETFTHPGANT